MAHGISFIAALEADKCLDLNFLVWDRLMKSIQWSLINCRVVGKHEEASAVPARTEGTNPSGFVRRLLGMHFSSEMRRKA
jgi:hypothetical protein